MKSFVAAVLAGYPIDSQSGSAVHLKRAKSRVPQSGVFTDCVAGYRILLNYEGTSNENDTAHFFEAGRDFGGVVDCNRVVAVFVCGEQQGAAGDDWRWVAEPHSYRDGFGELGAYL